MLRIVTTAGKRNKFVIALDLQLERDGRKDEIMNAKCLILFLALAPVMIKAQINYAISNNVAYVASGWNASGNAVIISNYNGYPVTSISAEAFDGCTGLKSIAIPDSVTNIGRTVFKFCTNLTSVAIPGSVKYIGDYAFGSCWNLTNITFLGDAPTLETSVPAFGTQAFYQVPGTVYYYYGTSGWGATYGGLPTVELSPTPQIIRAHLINSSGPLWCNELSGYGWT